MDREQIQEALNEGHIIECKGEFTEGKWVHSIVNDEKTAQEADLKNYEYRIKPISGS